MVNLTGVSPTADTWLVAYANGTSRPRTSNLNLRPNSIRANMATVPVGSDGRIRIYNHTGSVDLVVDMIGFYANTSIAADKNAGSQYYPVQPYRLQDQVVSANTEHASPPINGLDSDVEAVALSITVAGPTAPGYVWLKDRDKETKSTLNFARGDIVTNMAIAPVEVRPNQGTLPAVSYGVHTTDPMASARVLVDVVGYYAKGRPRAYAPLR